MCLWLSRLIGAIFKKNNSMAIRLLINGTQADLGNNAEGLLLFNYGAGDLDAPAVVQNAYSKEVVLPPTQENARLFGAWMQPDKVRGVSDAFDALARMPFEIRSNGDEVLEAGYVKLESVSADGYAIHLYGGLGGFLYGLMYGEDGERKTLASLRWSDAIEEGLSFNIRKDLVAAAWTRINSRSADAAIEEWADVINFAPMQNGMPDNFDCNKGLVPVGAEHGCPAVTGEHGVGGYALVEFGREFNEWEVRDLRSYLQRPVISIRAVLDALSNPANNGGYTFDWSAVSSLDDLMCWMTLPMLGVDGEAAEETTLSPTYDRTDMPDLFNGGKARVSFASLPESGSKVEVNLLQDIRFTFTEPTGDAPATEEAGLYGTYVFLRLIAYDSNDEVAAYGKIRCLTDALQPWTPYQAATKLQGNTVDAAGNYTNAVLGPFNADAIEVQMQGKMDNDAGNVWTDLVALSVKGYDIARVELCIIGVGWARGVSRGVRPHLELYDADGRVISIADINTTTIRPQRATAVAETAGRIRSGAYITKSALLDGTPSPADLLLSLVKTFGLVLRYDALEKRVELMQRGDFYTGAEVNLSQRIDRARAYKVEPNIIAEKWLRFAFGDAQGAFAETYRQKYGREYGDKRVNTGSPFNAETLQVLEGVKFVEGVSGVAYSRYYWMLKDSAVGTGILPSPYLDNNCKYTLWDGADAAQQHDVQSLTAGLVLTPVCTLNIPDPGGYDGDFRLQLAGADGQKDGDGAGILLWRDSRSHEYVHLTDDTPAMLNANNGTPCWIPCLTDDTTTMELPVFISYHLRDSYGDVQKSLNMGTPLELFGFDYGYNEGKAVYDRRWRAYIADRYNENSHRVTCWVDWRGMKIGQDMFRPFYWFGGCWWVLEKISDYCWDNPQPCECTFVRVLDKGAYTNGQN